MLMDVATRIRHIPEYRPDGEAPQKCTLLGTYEQMGPAKLSESRRFFEEGLRFEKGTDRLCAISLTKRFAFQHYFKDRLGIDPDDYHFPSTKELCRRSGGDHRYYALLVMDGDHMGTAPSGDFVLLVPAAKDEGQATMEPEALHKASTRASHTGHPAVFLLFPLTPKEIPNTPKLVKQMGDHWVVQVKLDVVVNGKKAVLGLALTLIGVSSAA